MRRKGCYRWKMGVPTRLRVARWARVLTGAQLQFWVLFCLAQFPLCLSHLEVSVFLPPLIERDRHRGALRPAGRVAVVIEHVKPAALVPLLVSWTKYLTGTS